jgi:hypothetical protein
MGNTISEKDEVTQDIWGRWEMSKGVYNRNDNLLDEDGNQNVFDY